MRGLESHLVLTSHDRQSGAMEGNLLLDHLFGARVHMVPSVDPMLAVGHDEAVVARGGRGLVAPRRPALRDSRRRLERRRRARLRGRHRSNWCDSCEALGVGPRALYFASGSRGTQAGLTLGAHLLRRALRLHGVAVSGGEPEKIERARRVAREAAALLDAGDSVRPREFFTDQTLHRRRVRRADRRRRSRPSLLAGAHRGARPRPDLHVEGDGRTDRARARRRALRQPTRSCSCTPAARPALLTADANAGHVLGPH